MPCSDSQKPVHYLLLGSSTLSSNKSVSYSVIHVADYGELVEYFIGWEIFDAKIF